ncbi:MAG: DUF2341 domain-containing protein [Pseudomonadota bacterium]
MRKSATTQRLAAALSAAWLIAMTTLVATPAWAWWNEDWQFRKDITVSVGAAGADAAVLENVPVLVRLHIGNFGYFGDTAPNGADLRFVAEDDTTVLKHYIETYDPVNFVANVWVQVPRLLAGTPYNFSMYYSNPEAVSSSSSQGVYDVDQVLVLPFTGPGTVVNDVTAYEHRLSGLADLFTDAALIGGGAQFTDADSVLRGELPPTNLDATQGFSLSAWVRPADVSGGALFTLDDGADGSLSLYFTGGTYAMALDGQPLGDPVVAVPESWQHVTLVAGDGQLTLFIDGAAAATAALPTSPVYTTLTLGGGADVPFTGLMDEVRAASVARPAGLLAARAAMEGIGSVALVYGEDQVNEESGGEPSYFLITLQNVTFDGWVVIVILAIMAVASWVIMALKGLTIRQVRKDNAKFTADFYSKDLKDMTALDHDDEDDEPGGMLDIISGSHDHYQASTLYHLYHAGIQEVKRRTEGSTVGARRVGTLAPESVEAIRATLDANMVRETQRLNSMMVLLTIAIAGGPFLGLLGTVVGVMITFAAIAASGDVNVNAIAPGIAAALAATVAGLAVAIPALFGYNYIASRIKEIVADMRVFLDEFVTRIGEEYRRD